MQYHNFNSFYYILELVKTNFLKFLYVQIVVIIVIFIPKIADYQPERSMYGNSNFS